MEDNKKGFAGTAEYGILRGDIKRLEGNLESFGKQVERVADKTGDLTTTIAKMNAVLGEQYSLIQEQKKAFKEQSRFIEKFSSSMIRLDYFEEKIKEFENDLKEQGEKLKTFYSKQVVEELRRENDVADKKDRRAMWTAITVAIASGLASVLGMIL